MGLNQKQYNKHILFLKAEMTLQTFSKKVHLNLNMNDMESVTKARGSNYEKLRENA